jgi:Lsr2
MKEVVTTTKLWDDLSLRNDIHLEANQTVMVGIDGQWYELDLSDGHAKELRKFVSTYAEAGRKIRNRNITVAKPSAHQYKAEAEKRAKIREWARTQKDFKDLPSVKGTQGKLPAAVVNAYGLAHPQFSG